MIKEPDKIEVIRDYIKEVVSNTFQVHIPTDNYSCLLINIPFDSSKYVFYIPCKDTAEVTLKYLTTIYSLFTLEYIWNEYKDLKEVEFYVLSEFLNKSISDGIKATNNIIKDFFEDSNEISNDDFSVIVEEDNVLNIKFKLKEIDANTPSTP